MRESTWSDAELADVGLQPSQRRVSIPHAPQDVGSVIGHAGAPAAATALIGRHRRVSFGELQTEVDAAAAALTRLGLRPKDRIAATAANDVDIVVAFLAAQRLGAVWIGINRALAPAEKAFLLRDSGALIYLADTASAAQARALRACTPDLAHILTMEPGDEAGDWRSMLREYAEVRPPTVVIDPWAPAAIAYTSGTTGFPKGVVHSQHNIMVAATIAEAVARHKAAGVVRATPGALTVLNMMAIGPIATLAKGSVHVCMDRIDATGVADWIEKESVNTLSLVPTVIQDLLTRPNIQGRNLSSLTWVNAGGAMVPEGLPDLYYARFGHPLSIGYGLTEVPAVVSRTHENSAKVQGAVGRPMPHLRTGILDESGHELLPGESGEIALRACESGAWAHVYSPPLGYWRKSDATATLLSGGWLHTGDIGYLDQAGELYIRDRRSDVIIRGGSNVYPAEVERVLRQHPAVHDCAVFGRPDQRLGETVAVAIQLKSDAGDEVVPDLRAICAREIAVYKAPVEWHIVAELPRNTAGKVVKARLKEMLLAPHPQGHT